MSEPRAAVSKGRRDPYSRLICLGCRERRIKCELPSGVQVPNPGELRTAETPCYRCKRLDIPCVIRRTILGRPGPERISTTAANIQPADTGDIFFGRYIDLPSRALARTQPATAQSEIPTVNSSVAPHARVRYSIDLSLSQEEPARSNENSVLIRTPQSAETVFVIRALDTLRSEHVEKEWFRHLPAHVGHTHALDLCIKAMVAACAYTRGVPKLTSGDCYQALALALSAVQVDIKQSHGEPTDDILASTALMTPFEGTIKRNGIPTRLHVEGLAAILTARPATYPVTQLARDIVGFFACESSIMACVQDTPSPFEGVAQAYYANDRTGYSDGDRAQLKALGTELFIRIPRLVKLVRSLRRQLSPQNQLLSDALRLSKSLLMLRDSQAESRLLRNLKTYPSSNPDATYPIRQSLHFDSIEDFEALTYYWQSRLSLLRLEGRLHDLSLNMLQVGSSDDLEHSLRPAFGPRTDEIFRYVNSLLMCTEYSTTLRLHKQVRLFAHAMVVVWGAKMDVTAALSCDQDEEELDPLSDLLLRRVSIALAAKPGFTVEDMNTAAAVFAGGQPEGRFAELYGL